MGIRNCLWKNFVFPVFECRFHLALFSCQPIAPTPLSLRKSLGWAEFQDPPDVRLKMVDLTSCLQTSIWPFWIFLKSRRKNFSYCVVFFISYYHIFTLHCIYLHGIHRSVRLCSFVCKIFTPPPMLLPLQVSFSLKKWWHTSPKDKENKAEKACEPFKKKYQKHKLTDLALNTFFGMPGLRIGLFSSHKVFFPEPTYVVYVCICKL